MGTRLTCFREATGSTEASMFQKMVSVATADAGTAESHFFESAVPVAYVLG